MKFPLIGTSRSVLLLLLLWLLIAAGAGYMLRDWIHLLYFENQLTLTGLTVNGVIVGLFAIGMLKLIFILNFYRLQETAVQRVLRNLASGEKSPLHGVSEQSLIASRYKAMEALQYKNLLAVYPSMAISTANTESARMGLARFVNNILILVGVFGTVVSLSLSLVGASDLLTGLGSDASGVNNIVHGMSTALSTTISAIFCYLFFGYFYLSTLHVQSRFLSQFEGLISQHLLPRLAVDQEALPIELYGLIKGLRESSQALESHHQALESAFGQLVELSSRLNDRIERGGNAMAELVQQMQQFPDIGKSLEEMKVNGERTALSSENIGNLIGTRLVSENQAASERLERAVQSVAETVNRQGNETRALQVQQAEKNLTAISQGLRSLSLAENLQSLSGRLEQTVQALGERLNLEGREGRALQAQQAEKNLSLLSENLQSLNLTEDLQALGNRLEQLVGAFAERLGQEGGEIRAQSSRHAEQSLAAFSALEERIGREGSETRSLQQQHRDSGQAVLQELAQSLAVGEHLQNLAARIEAGLASLNELITREGGRQQSDAANAFAQTQNLLERLGSTLASVGERVSREAEESRNQQQSLAETGRTFLNQELGGIELSGPLTEAVGRIEQALNSLGQQLAREEDETRRHLSQNMQALETILREHVKAALKNIGDKA